ncbi:MAG: PIN domain-containing protein [Isosphaeraceae bacterium]|nr:PIN domain-containing protein [Isosphaeraceae bacterium]
MRHERFLIDTVFVQALVSKRDQYHGLAVKHLPRLREAGEAVITEAVPVELAGGMCAIDRKAASEWINSCYRTANMRVVATQTVLVKRALHLYETRLDKEWSLTDCISFVVMQDNGLTIALTADKHFVQAGFRALLLEEA